MPCDRRAARAFFDQGELYASNKVFFWPAAGRISGADGGAGAGRTQGPAPAAACEARTGAPQWLPCGPDRVFTEAEVKSLLIKEDAITKMVVTSGKSGKRFFIHFKPGGKLDSGPDGGTNFGKSWKFKGNQVCRDYYRITQVDCGVFELQGSTLYLVDDDGARSPVNALEFAKP